ncbi:hypothetical protein [Acrocarpospora catenulata]|uniref:hypothetical protein n=1 Tax=Acrocarpospora catenulata TaxID=2836182 RepID=UPI001BD963C7|nr:hypothetical protein [Acrocarpospora catenulata]
MARSRGRRRRPRSRVAGIGVGLACLVAGAAVVVVPLLRPDPVPSGTVPAPISGSPAPDGELQIASAGEKPETSDDGDVTAEGPSKYTDEVAVAYFNRRWPDKTNGRVTDIRTTGRYLRIYTDLPESAANSRTALRLCERGLLYLDAIGEANPVVFVQAEFGENGNPVLANILGPDDRDCRVTHPRPGTT